MKLVLLLAAASLIFGLMLLLTHHNHVIDYREFLTELLGTTSRRAHSFGPELFVNINRDISAIGGPTEMIIITSFFSVYLFFVKEYKILFKFTLAVLVTAAVLFSLKFIFNHARPDSLLDFIFADNLNFPSGHAMASLVVFSLLASYINRKTSDKAARFVVNACAAVIILLIGTSRVITGAHNPWEVIAGWCAGLSLLAVINYFGGIHPVKKFKERR